jgi:predicted RNase H-like HicB family nuclease
MLRHTVRTRVACSNGPFSRVFRGESKYVAECLDLPVVTEGDTLDELASNIQEAISLHLEGENLAELGFSADPTILATMELDAVA